MNIRQINFTRGLLTLIAVFMIGFSPASQAQLSIDIRGVGATQIPINIAPFVGNDAFTEDVQQVIMADLARSGFFNTIRTTSNVILDEESLIDPSAWRSIGVDALVAGSIRKLADGRVDIRFNLHDTVKQTSLGRFSFRVAPASIRITAHRIADYIYEQFIGEPGIFATRIAYVEKSKNSYRLLIADSDGANAQVALSSKEPIISPNWSPDGTQLAYVSFETRKPVVFIHTLATGRRQAVANFKGSNSAPVFSADGKTLAVVLTKDSGSQIYTMQRDGSGLRRLTSTGNINTEPFFSHDGQSIYFTSDRSGGPQIYKMDINGGNVSRVTFTGTYNISPRLSPDDKLMTYVTRREGRFRIATLNLETGAEAILTSTSRDESPSFAPNGRFILYATKAGSQGILSMVSNDGSVQQDLKSSNVDIAEPTWGPLLTNK